MVSDLTDQIPKYSVPLVGRKSELKQLDQYLSDPTIRLITISGLGGIGKTRLATEVASRSARLFEDGVVFVPLESTSSVEGLYLLIAEAAGLRLASEEPASTRVRDWISTTNVLLILDNFEQLVEEANVLPEILRLSQGSKIVATTRIVLGLEDEWNYPLGGLTTNDSGRQSDSVELFVNIAKRFEPNFHLEPSSVEYQLARDVCESLEGIPLAIEMAAAWIRALSLDELRSELGTTNELLISSRRDVPSRHQSIQSVFDSSWMLLDTDLRRKLNALAFLRGPFDRDTARNVAGATLLDLRTLVQASLLTAESDDQFRCHLVLRDCAVAKEIKGQNPDTIHAAIAKHYARLASNLWPGRSELSELDLTRLADRQFENFRLALEIANELKDWKVLRNLILFFALYMEFKSRYLEGMQILERVSQELEGDSDAESVTLRASVLSTIGWWHMRLGNTDQAMRFADEAIELFEHAETDRRAYLGDDPDLLKGFLAAVSGNTDVGREIAERKLEDSIAVDNVASRILSQYLLATIQLNAKEMEEARKNSDLLSDLAKESGAQWFEAYCLNLRGDLASADGNNSEAAELFRQSFKIRQQFEDPVGMGEALIKLGEVSLIAGEVVAAEESFINARSIMESAGDRGNMAIALNGLGLALVAQQRYDEAYDLLSEALTTGNRLRFTLLILRSLAGLARIQAACGNRKLASDAFEAVVNHPACDLFTRSIAGKAETGATDLGSKENPVPDLLELEKSLLDRTMLRDASERGRSAEAGLSEREVEILKLMASGKTNPEIAAELILSAGTVKWYSSQIYLKLQVRNRAQAISKAQDLSLI